MKKCAQKALGIYTALTAYQGFARRKHEDNFWLDAIRSIQIQWGLAKNLTQATGAFVSPALGTVQGTNTAQELAGMHVEN